MTTTAGTDAAFGVLKQIDAGLLSVGYAEAGPPNSVAALWPERCRAIVSVSGYLIGSPEATPGTRFLRREVRRQVHAPTHRGRCRAQPAAGSPQAFAEAVVEVDGY